MKNTPTNNPKKEPITFFPFLVLLTSINVLFNATVFVVSVVGICLLKLNDIWGYGIYLFFILPIFIMATMAISILVAFLIKNESNNYQRSDFLKGIGASILIMIVGLFFIAML